MVSHPQKVVIPFDIERNKCIEAHLLHERNYDMDFHRCIYLIDQSQNCIIDLVKILETHNDLRCKFLPSVKRVTWDNENTWEIIMTAQ